MSPLPVEVGGTVSIAKNALISLSADACAVAAFCTALKAVTKEVWALRSSVEYHPEGSS